MELVVKRCVKGHCANQIIGALPNYKNMKRVYGKQKGRLGRMEGFNLLWKLAKVNAFMLWARE